jgi:hypothetical protein
LSEYLAISVTTAVNEPAPERLPAMVIETLREQYARVGELNEQVQRIQAPAAAVAPPALGHVRDDPKVLRQLIDYLKRAERVKPTMDDVEQTEQQQAQSERARAQRDRHSLPPEALRWLDPAHDWGFMRTAAPGENPGA